MDKEELCNFCKQKISTLQDERKEEVMKCVGQFVRNPRIDELNKQIKEVQQQCPHLKVDNNGRCIYCGFQVENK